MGKYQKNCLLLEKLIKIKKDQSDNESDAIDIDQCDNEIELEEEVNKIESSSSEDEDLCYIAPNKKRARVVSDSETESEDEIFRYTAPSKKRARVISDSETENDLDAIDTSSDKEISAEKAADGTLWETLNEGRNVGRSPIYTIFKDVSGPTAYAKRHIMLGSASSAFNLIIDEGMMAYIKSCTELEAHQVLNNKEWTVTKSQLWAFVAILFARGAYEAKNLKCSYLWSAKWGPAFFAQTMSRDKFIDILRFIRFDKKNERSERLKTDKFALISKIWEKFIENSQACYKPDANITIDEQLFPIKARCRFTQYMPNKPDKFGIKFWLASDVRSKYLVNGFPYLGKDETRGSNIPLSEFVVTKLAEPYLGCGRNITTDNFFTSISLAKKLLAKKTTLVGTIRANRKELPKIAKAKKDKITQFSTKLYRSENCTLTIYKSKPNKKVLLLSTKHKNITIEKNKKLVPETVTYYNSTKYSVDVFDQMARKYSVKASSRRWPLQVFYNILDLAAINVWILYKETTQVNISRKDFIFQLAEELRSKYREEVENTSIPMTEIHATDARKNCQVQQSCKRNRCRNHCAKCNRNVCGKCVSKTEFICKKCFP
ncbi:piggyBac transposable element-derived protein 4-like [Harpegnathos saltator]|uniref:piggyBac transposable element-derived protein 4-like n=1 Tax=Harpegnathos saltator TaxID=610380 RepID=UPI000DBEE9E9|nr:piggyBac transposable element-derived protein 4-like [Harpegnathos saltator]